MVILLIQLIWLSFYKRFCFRVEFILLVSAHSLCCWSSYHLLPSHMHIFEY